MWQDGGSSYNILGTDKVGRDILSRIIYGSRISVIIALIAIVVSGIFGTTLGIVAGYWGGWADAVIMPGQSRLIRGVLLVGSLHANRR